MNAGSSKTMLPTNYSLTNHVNNMNIYKQDLALNDAPGLTCHKIQPSHRESHMS